jgi:dienelactone hydrolase
VAGLVLGLGIGGVSFWLTIKPYAPLEATLTGLGLLGMGLAFGAGTALILALVKKLRWQTILVITAATVFCLTAFMAAPLIVGLLIGSVSTIYLAVMLFSGRYKPLHPVKKVLRVGLLLLCLTLMLGTGVVAFTPGPKLSEADRPDRAQLALPYGLPIEQLAPLADPSQMGSYRHSVIYYASPKQRIDPYPGQERLDAPTADVTAFVDGWSGIRRSSYGFGPDKVPLNAEVWLPEGVGPFPLALIVHGNHEAGDRSDGGYAYLGEWLASRGIIAASVDENFLNSSTIYDLLVFASLREENDARAVVLLEHLNQWYRWNSQQSHRFFGKVDFDKIALIGHSRGGEAVAIAAAFAKLDYYPDNGAVQFDYPFEVNTVVAIAPVDRQYDPAGLETPLAGVNYLVIHGGNDMDVSSFMGANMYHRVDVAESGSKAEVWIEHANHGQFNSSWGAADLSGLSGLALNGRLLMPMADQQQAAKVLIGAFLESTLSGQSAYNGLFRDFAYGTDWLPRARYVINYADSNLELLNDFAAGIDLRQSSSGLVSHTGQGFETWTQVELPGKSTNSNRVLQLTWGNTEAKPVFETSFAEGVVTVGDRLYISLTSAKDDLSFQIKLTDAEGHTATVSIKEFGGVATPISAPVFKLPLSLLIGDREPILQLVCIPTDRFPGLGGEIVTMEWIMDPPTTGLATLYVDDLRIARTLTTGPTEPETAN